MIGGKECSQAELDRLGIVGLITSSMNVCTGTRIGDGLILTAKHCACGNGQLRNVIFSTDFFSENIVKRPVVDMAVSTEELGSDIALVRYAGAAPATHATAQLNVSPLDPVVDDAAQLLVYGFGKGVDGDSSSRDDGDGTGKLRRLDNRLVGLAAGEQTLTARPVRSWEGQCFGDSGGPAFILPGPSPRRSGRGALSQVGILSQGLISPSGGFCADGVEKYVDVASHADWIEEAASSLGGPRVLVRHRPPRVLTV